MIRFARLAFLPLIAGVPMRSAAQYQPRLTDVLTPEVGIASVGGGWLDQTRDDPKQWSHDAGGFATRIASRFGQAVIGNAVTVTGGLITGTDPRYHLCTCTDVPSRGLHGLLGPVRPLRILGDVAGAYTAMAWRPGPYDPVKGYQFALSSLAFQAGFDLIREIVR